MNGKPIFYSLGNFLFDNLNPPDGWNEGYMVKLDISKNIIEPNNHNQIKFELIPYTQSFEQGGIKLMAGYEKELFLKKIEEYRNILNNKGKYEKVWNDFCKNKKDEYLILQYSPFIIRGISRLLKTFGAEKILLKNQKRLATRLNYIRCESHKDVLLEILNNELIKRSNK